MKFRIALLCLVFFLVSLTAAAQSDANIMSDLAKIKTGVKSKRVSSYDRSGGNNDRFENIPDGERRTLFEVEGAGIIRHIWITIAPPPPALSRNDIILRMYWDGETEPSVQAPIGPFFGQGWDEAYNFSTTAAGRGTGHRAAAWSAILPCLSRMGRGLRLKMIRVKKSTPSTTMWTMSKWMSCPSDQGRFHAWYNTEVTEALESGENEWGYWDRLKRIPPGTETT